MVVMKREFVSADSLFLDFCSKFKRKEDMRIKKIGKKISYFKDKNDLLEILSGRLKNLKIEKIVFNTENSEMIFIAKAGEEI